MNVESRSFDPSEMRSYEERLGEIFERKRNEYVKFANSLLIKSNMYKNFDLKTASNDIVQEVFLTFLKNANINFVDYDQDQIDNFCSVAIKNKTRTYILTYYNNTNDRKERSHRKIPESSYIPLEEIGDIMTYPDFTKFDEQELLKIISETKNLTEKERSAIINVLIKGKTMTEFQKEEQAKSAQVIRNRINIGIRKLRQNPRLKNYFNQSESN